MVNPGHPSRACKSCKVAKTKCSEEQPSCRRCIKKGSSCVYAESTFRSMNEWSEANVKTRVAAKLSVRSAKDGSHATISPLASTISSDWIQDAVLVFFREFVREPDHLQSTWGNLTCLPAAYRRKDLPFLSSAVEACAISYLANSSGHTELDATATIAHSETIMHFAPALQDPNRAASDESLACMMLLSLYETISGTKPSTELFHAHQRGQSAAVHLRMQASGSHDAKLCSSWTDRCILGQTNRQLVWRDLGDRNVPTLSATEWPDDTYRSWLDEASARISVQIANVCGRAKTLQIRFLSASGGLSHEELATCIDDAVLVYAAIEACSDAAPPGWKVQQGPQQTKPAFGDTVSAETLSNLESRLANFSLRSSEHSNHVSECESTHRNSYKPRTDIYPSRAVMLLWNNVRGVKLHLIRAMMDLRSMGNQASINISSSGLPTAKTLQQNLSDTVQDICATVPYALGDVQSSGTVSGPSADLPAMLWALHKVCCIPGLSPEIRDWTITVFQRIGRERHVRQGLNLAKLYSQERPCLAT